LRKRPPFRKLRGDSIHSQSGRPRKVIRRKRLPCEIGETRRRWLKRKIAGAKPGDEVAAGRTRYWSEAVRLSKAWLFMNTTASPRN
jgi:hypothetical protein